LIYITNILVIINGCAIAIAGVLIPHYGTIPIFFANGLLLIVDRAVHLGLSPTQFLAAWRRTTNGMMARRLKMVTQQA
jgi:hypothetical protein